MGYPKQPELFPVAAPGYLERTSIEGGRPPFERSEPYQLAAGADDITSPSTATVQAHRALMPMTSRIVLSGLILALALARCKTVPGDANYNLADHPGKGLVLLSTRMNAGAACTNFDLSGRVGFWQVKDAARLNAPGGQTLPVPQTGGEDSISFPVHVPRPQRKVNDMGGEVERIVAAEPPALFVVEEVPAGLYLLNSLNLDIDGGTTGRYKATNLSPLSFTVKEGEVVYLGEVSLSVQESDCAYGYLKLSGARFTFSIEDQWRRDGVQFQTALHNIGPEAVQKRLAQRR